MNIAKYISYLAVLVLISACQSETPEVKALNWVYSADPVHDARETLKENNPVFWVLKGNGEFVPGLPDNCDRSKLKTRPFPADFHRDYGYEYARSLAVASTYARYFNTTLFLALYDSKQLIC